MKETIYNRLDAWLAHCRVEGIEIKRLLVHPKDMEFIRKDKGVGPKSLVTHRGHPIESMKQSIYFEDKAKADAMYGTLVGRLGR